MNIYIDGKQQATQIKMDSLRGATILNGNDFLVGNWNHRKRETENLYGFKGGTIDNVLLYNRTLSPIEVKYLSGNKGPSSRNDLYAHYLQKQDSEFHSLKIVWIVYEQLILKNPR